MAESPVIRFENGAVYEGSMGRWSRAVGEIFLDWLAVPKGLRWVDVGCGSGVFAQLLVDTVAPAEVQGIDPSEGQIAFAREQHGGAGVAFRTGDAMALPFPDASFDAAVMALVIFFVPDPPKGVAEMVRVVRPGGTISAYAWDIPGGGFPHEPILAAMRALGHTPARTPQADAGLTDNMRTMWADAGLEDIATRQITVERTFTDFEDYWAQTSTIGSIATVMGSRSPAENAALKAGARANLKPDAAGRITVPARANAVKGCVPR